MAAMRQQAYRDQSARADDGPGCLSCSLFLGLCLFLGAIITYLWLRLAGLL
jgi:hypothetical protein